MLAEWIPALTAKALAALDRRRLPGTIASAVAVVIGLVLFSATVFGNPDDGEPRQVMRLERLPATGLGGPIVAPPPSELALADGPAAPSGPGTADPALLETTRDGFLPKIGADGRKPMKVYARAYEPASDARPKIAIVVGSMGVGQAIRDSALARLPAEVSLAFTPYGPSLGDDVAAARAKGHEVLLEVPLEPEDYPSTDPGVHTLTTAASADKNNKHLIWLLSRFTGYAGLISSHGSKYLADNKEASFLMKRVAARGLFFVDATLNTGATSRDAASAAGAAFARVDSIADRTLLRDAIDKELAALEATARKRGFAIGSVGALSITVDRVAVWAEGLAAKGIALVPVSALVSGGGQSVAAVRTPAARPTAAKSAPKLVPKKHAAKPARRRTTWETYEIIEERPARRTRRRPPAATTPAPAPVEPTHPTSAPHP